MIFFFPKGETDWVSRSTAILCTFLLLYIGSKKCIRSDRLVRYFTTEQNTLDRSKINTFSGNLKRRDLSLTGLKTK